MGTSRKDIQRRMFAKDWEFEELLRDASRFLSGSGSSNPVAGKALIKPFERKSEAQARFESSKKT